MGWIGWAGAIELGVGDSQIDRRWHGFGSVGIVLENFVGRKGRGVLQYGTVSALSSFRFSNSTFSRLNVGWYARNPTAFRNNRIVVPSHRIRIDFPHTSHSLPNPNTSPKSVSIHPHPIHRHIKTYALLSDLSGTLILRVAEQLNHAALIRGETSDLLDDAADEGGAAGEVALGAGDAGALLDLLGFLY